MSTIGGAREITDRLEGKIRQQLEGEDDEPGTVNVIIQHVGRGDDEHLCRAIPGTPAKQGLKTPE